MKITERRETTEKLIYDINNTIRDIKYYQSDTHGNSYYLYALWPTGTKITFIIGVTVATMLLLGVKITGAIIPSLPLAIVLLLTSMILYWSPGYRKYRLIHWNTKKAIRRLRDESKRLERDLNALRIEMDFISKKQDYARSYSSYLKRKAAIQNEVPIYRPKIEAFYGLIQKELGGEVHPKIEKDECGHEFESEIAVCITLPLENSADYKVYDYEFSKHDCESLIIRILKLRPVIRERRALLAEVGALTT